MLEALISGQRNPRVLAGLAKGRARIHTAELEDALHGRFTDHHARLARILLEQIDELDAHITQVTTLLDNAITTLPSGPDTSDTPTGTDPAGYNSAVQRLSEIPGVGPDSARAVIGEIGLDMSVFGTHQRLCSWAKTSPRTVQSGRKTGRATTGKGNPYLKAALGQMATSAAKTNTFLGQRYRRLIKRMPKPKALAALERSILVIIFHLLEDPNTEFKDLGADFYTRRIDRDHRTNQLTHQLQALGYTVTLTTTAA
jgi:transposase